MERKSSTVALLLVDIVATTSLYDRFDDQIAHRRMTFTLSLIRQLVGDYEGFVIKVSGSEVMCAFDSLVDATECALNMEDGTREAGAESENSSDEIPLPLRVILHYGEVVHESGDLYGANVNLALGILGLSKDSGIWVTREVVEFLPYEMLAMVTDPASYQIEGIDKAVEAYPMALAHEYSDITDSAENNESENKKIERILELRINETVYLVNKSQSRIQIGRSPDCDITLDDEEVSRYHAVIDMREDDFVLTDKSANGTYVATASGDNFVLKRNEGRLVGMGSIRLGRKPWCITYEVKYKKTLRF